MERLSAKSNEKIKLAVSLRDSAKSRRKNGMFFLEGARLCFDAAENGVGVERAFFTLAALEKYPEYVRVIAEKCSECYEISDEIALKLSDTQTPQGVFCICVFKKIMTDKDKIKSDGKYILLENIQDPANLGAISRTAEALGIDGMIVSGGCDIYNPKALRASMGSALRINLIEIENTVEFLKEANKLGINTLAATPDSSAVEINKVRLDSGAICVVGNEGNGVTAPTADTCSLKVTIPMGGRAESLNASTAAAILIWEMVRR